MSTPKINPVIETAESPLDENPAAGTAPASPSNTVFGSLRNLYGIGKSKIISATHSTVESLDSAYTKANEYVGKHIEDKDSKLGKILRPVVHHKTEFKVGAAALAAVAFTGVAYKKYQNMKMTKLQKQKIEILKKEKMTQLKAELDKLDKTDKNKLSAARKKKIMTLFLLGSVGAIILGSKVKSLKKGGSNKKKTLKM